MTPDVQVFLPARLNPFRTECLHRLPFLPHPAAENSVFAALEQSGWTGGIVGPHGSGKTTLLLRLQEMMQAKKIHAEFFQCLEQEPSLSSMDWKRISDKPPGTVLLLDGADLVSRRAWGRLRSLARSGLGLITTSHHDLRGCPTVYTTDPSPERLADLIRHLHPRILDEANPETLYAKHEGNIRDALRELYDRCAGKVW